MPEAKRKISLLFSESEFTSLEDERHRQRTTFQAIGYARFMDWLRSGKSSTATTDKSEGLPPSGTDSKSGIYNPGKSTSMDSPRQFLERISSLLQSVPEDSRPAVEEYLAKVAARAVEPFTTGVLNQNEQQRAANQPAAEPEVHFDELHESDELENKPADTRHLPAKQA